MPRCAPVFLQLHLQRTSVSEGESWEHPTKPPFLPQDLIEQDRYVGSVFFLPHFSDRERGQGGRAGDCTRGRERWRVQGRQGGRQSAAPAPAEDGRGHEPGHGGLPGA